MAGPATTYDDTLGFYDPKKTYEENWQDGPFAPDDFKPVIDSGQPPFEFLGIPIHSPFGIPAGPLLNSNHVKYAFDNGFDVICYKTQRSIPFTVNEFPNVLYLDVEGDLSLDQAEQGLVGHKRPTKPLDKVSITNSFGNPSRGPSFWVDDLKQALTYQKDGQLLIMSVVGTIQPGFSSEDYYNDFAEAAELAASTGVKAIEINLSCPNVASEGVLCYTKDAVVAVCQKVKAKIGDIPLIVKFGYFSEQQEAMLEDTLTEITPFISAISAINTLSAPVRNEAGEQALPGEGRLSSGICGASIKWAGLDMVQRLNKLKDKNNWDYQIIGVGGVMNPADFNDYRKAGADVVQSATAAMWNPKLAQQIKTNIKSQ